MFSLSMSSLYFLFSLPPDQLQHLCHHFLTASAPVTELRGSTGRHVSLFSGGCPAFKNLDKLVTLRKKSENSISALSYLPVPPFLLPLAQALDCSECEISFLCLSVPGMGRQYSLRYGKYTDSYDLIPMAWSSCNFSLFVSTLSSSIWKIK